MIQFSHQLGKLLFNCGIIAVAKRSLCSDDEIDTAYLVLIFSEQLAQDPPHIVSINRMTCRLFRHYQAQTRPSELVVLIVYGQKVACNTLAEIKNG